MVQGKNNNSLREKMEDEAGREKEKENQQQQKKQKKDKDVNYVAK